MDLILMSFDQSGRALSVVRRLGNVASTRELDGINPDFLHIFHVTIKTGARSCLCPSSLTIMDQRGSFIRVKVQTRTIFIFSSCTSNHHALEYLQPSSFVCLTTRSSQARTFESFGSFGNRLGDCNMWSFIDLCLRLEKDDRGSNWQIHSGPDT